MAAGIRGFILLLFGATWLCAQHTELFLHSEADRTTGRLVSGVTLKGTKPLDLPDDLFNGQWKQLDAYYRNLLRQTPAKRDALWKTAGTPTARRERLTAMLGSSASVGAHSSRQLGPRVEEIEVATSLGGARALLFLPEGEGRSPLVIAVPPDEIPRDAFVAGPAPWLTYLLSRRVAVLVPSMVERTLDHPMCQRTRGKDRRHILHRLAFVVGRTVPGIEVSQIRALIDVVGQRPEIDGKRIGIAGFGQGGMTALYAAALDFRIAGAVAGGYFGPREEGWKEPVDRMLYGQLNEFGDAEVAALIAPRKLALVRGSVPAPEFERETARAKRYLPDLRAEEGEALDARSAALAADLVGAPASASTAALSLEIGAADTEASRNRHFESLVGAIRREVEASESVRHKKWALETPGGADAKAAALRAELLRMMGKTTEPRVPLNPRTRLIRVTEKYLGFDVMLDVIDGVEAYGQLLVPREPGRRLPAVVAQHGLGGKPKDITLLGPKPEKAYNGFGEKLAREGYVVFAPYVTHPIPQAQLINPLVRMAGAVGRMRVSPEVTKLNAIVDFLQSLAFVDPQRIGYYGLSYGGYSAIWMGPMEPRLKAVVVSGHFNDWRYKITNDELTTSYLQHPDEDFSNWDTLHRFTHVELIAAAYPRAVCVEFADRDATTTPEWHQRAWSEVERIARAWGVPERFVRDHFDGVHEVQAIGGADFLDRWLRPERAAGRDYRYALWPSLRPLPGLGDINADTLPYVSRSLSSDDRVRGTFYGAPSQPLFRGLAVRASRTGKPGDLVVRYGTTPGAADLGEARIAPDRVYPLYDLWVDAAVAPKPLTPGRTYYFEVSAAYGKHPRNYYTIYGPKLIGGTRYPEDFALAFRLLDGKLGGREETFSFLRDYLSPYQAGAGVRRRAASGPGVTLNGEWTLQSLDADEVTAYAAADLRSFLKNAFGVQLAAKGSRVIRLQVVNPVEGVTQPEGFRIDAAAGSIIIQGLTPRGVLRGVYAFEDMLRDAGAPSIASGVTTRNPRFTRRITTSLLPGGERYTETSRELLYTDGLLERMSHDGFNAVWIWLNTEEATMNSRLLPEFNDPMAQIRLERIQDLSRRARRYGIDVYTYLATGYHHWTPESFFDQHPDLRGQGWGRPLCTSQKIVRDYYRETVQGIFRTAPDLKGLVVIYDSEGFYYCGHSDRSRRQCPRCRNTTNEALAKELLTTLMDAMRSQGGPSKEFVAWDYGAAVVASEHLNWVNRLLPQLPKEMMLMTDFSKNGLVERDGVKHFTGDYNLTLVGPPQQFLDQQKIAVESGHTFIAKTEHAISQEFIFVPYIPAMEQWSRRISKIREFSLGGWFGNWSHYGYTPSVPAQLVNRMSWDPAPDTPALLASLARRHYGPAAPAVVRAWSHFSDGIREFPYSDSVSRTPGPLQKGPSNPFFLDPSVPSFGPWRTWQNDLKWTAPWGPEIAAKYLGRVRDAFRRGIAELEQARSSVQGEDREALDREWRIARTIEISLQSTLHLAEWLRVRDRAWNAEPTERRRYAEQLAAIVKAERRNAEAALPILEADSRLGHASEGGGIVRGGLFTADLVRWKIGLMDDLLVRQLPAFGGIPVELPAGGALDSLLSVH